MEEKPRVSIQYCTGCRWLLRAAWMAQELLSTFEQELGEVALIPQAGGAFSVQVGAVLVWDRKVDGGFPEIAELKRRVRDVIHPGKSLGHLDRGATPEQVSANDSDSSCPI